jgi:hypothetical protein
MSFSAPDDLPLFLPSTPHEDMEVDRDNHWHTDHNLVQDMEVDPHNPWHDHHSVAHETSTPDSERHQDQGQHYGSNNAQVNPTIQITRKCVEMSFYVR